MKPGVWILLLAAIFSRAAAINYTYDAAGRLTKVDYGNGSAITYAYDSAGNLISRQVAAGGPLISSVTTASGGTTISQNDFIVIKGANLVPVSTPSAGVIWNTAPSFAMGQMPTQLNGISVTVNGKAAFVYFFCSAATDQACAMDQINALTPLDNSSGAVQVVVNNGATPSPPFTVNMSSVAPALLLFGASQYVVATHANNSLLGPTTLYPGLSTPAKAGETVVLYAVGFGLPSSTLTNGSSSQSGSLPALPVCNIGKTSSPAIFAGLIGPGLYQINLTVPPGASSGDNPISCAYAGATTPAGDLITVQ